MRAIPFRVLQPYLNQRRIGRALGAGCGAGYLSHLLQTEREMQATPMDFSREGLRGWRVGRGKNPDPASA
jgi:hypothetical protein